MPNQLSIQLGIIVYNALYSFSFCEVRFCGYTIWLATAYKDKPKIMLAKVFNSLS